MPHALDDSGVHIRYRFTESLDRHKLDAAVALLSSAERERWARFVFDRDRRDYAVAHALLRTTLSLYDPCPPDGWVFETDSYGKPHIVSAGGPSRRLSFSLSHSSGLVGCAVASGVQIGLDVACLDRVVEADTIGRRCFSSTEMAHLADCPEGQRRARFFELWTLKEAFAKAVGRGLSLPLSSVTFDLATDHRIAVTPPPDHAATGWHCALFTVGSRHVLALAVSGVATRRISDSVRVDGDEGAARTVLVRASDETG